jgi:transglutaminase-like putative cysteine protease
VEFTAEFTVQRSADAPPLRVADDGIAELFLTHTALTAPCARIRDAARLLMAEIEATPIAELAAEVLPNGAGDLDAAGVRRWAAALCGRAWAERAIAYQFGATGVKTPAAMALHLGRGVCQDFAHLAISMLREMGVPVRYVSGHLLGEGAPHAWIETLLPDPHLRGLLRVVAYDPTHHITPGLNYITIAVGRDYGDIAPTSGTFQGASGYFTARKNAWIVELA